MTAHYCPECGHEHLLASDARAPLDVERLRKLAAEVLDCCGVEETWGAGQCAAHDDLRAALEEPTPEAGRRTGRAEPRAEGPGHRTTEPHNCFAMNCKALGPEIEGLRERLAVVPALPCAELREAALAVCFSDLRDGFQDGDDIVLRWSGNIADWQRLRAALEEPTPERYTDTEYEQAFHDREVAERRSISEEPTT